MATPKNIKQERIHFRLDAQSGSTVTIPTASAQNEIATRFFCSEKNCNRYVEPEAIDFFLLYSFVEKNLLRM